MEFTLTERLPGGVSFKLPIAGNIKQLLCDVQFEITLGKDNGYFKWICDFNGNVGYRLDLNILSHSKIYSGFNVPIPNHTKKISDFVTFETKENNFDLEIRYFGRYYNTVVNGRSLHECYDVCYFYPLTIKIIPKRSLEDLGTLKELFGSSICPWECKVSFNKNFKLKDTVFKQISGYEERYCGLKTFTDSIYTNNSFASQMLTLNSNVDKLLISGKFVRLMMKFNVIILQPLNILFREDMMFEKIENIFEILTKSTSGDYESLLTFKYSFREGFTIIKTPNKFRSKTNIYGKVVETGCKTPVFNLTLNESGQLMLCTLKAIDVYELGFDVSELSIKVSTDFLNDPEATTVCNGLPFADFFKLSSTAKVFINSNSEYPYYVVTHANAGNRKSDDIHKFISKGVEKISMETENFLVNNEDSETLIEIKPDKLEYDAEPIDPLKKVSPEWCGDILHTIKLRYNVSDALDLVLASSILNGTSKEAIRNKFNITNAKIGDKWVQCDHSLITSLFFHKDPKRNLLRRLCRLNSLYCLRRTQEGFFRCNTKFALKCGVTINFEYLAFDFLDPKEIHSITQEEAVEVTRILNRSQVTKFEVVNGFRNTKR
uniref:CPd protein n=1 Tax=Grapevine leafroll-associated virus 7 TaxID=217615 RepID=A0A811AR70_9CLOS|nr:CPd protein [Grapevine leafroll-associated virus 7]